MKRSALIVGNPGIVGRENYCHGVSVDIKAYRDYLKSATGGAWLDSEIRILEKPQKIMLNLWLNVMRIDTDYAFLVFAGHGSHSQKRDDTVLAINDTEEIDARDFCQGARKQTVILDCCRVLRKELVLEAMAKDELIKRAADNVTASRRLFDDAVERCGPGSVILHGCAIEESAGDDSQRGGYYSSALLGVAKEWRDHFKPSQNNILSIVEAHNVAAARVTQRSRSQTPQIEKPRSGPYFPFAVGA